MLTIREAKVIAGRMLVEKYGYDFLRNNTKKISSSVMKKDNNIVNIFFDLAEKDIDSYDDLFHMKGNEHFGEIIFSASVDLNNGEATAI